MCLYSKTNIPSIAQEDITCYKVFEVNPFNDTLLMTPYRLIVVNLENFPLMFVASPNKEVIPICASWTHNLIRYQIGPGFIHAYTHPIDNASHRFRVVLCKIPKGTKYYVSECGKEICASQMELIKII